jgi:RND superfamily putative drug exporter
MLGLAVGIDYALIMVSRFREESTTTPITESVPRVVETAGRAVMIAGSTVAIGLMGLLLFGVPAAISTGLAGACVVLACVLLSLTALPASFVLWGHRIGKRRAWIARRPRHLPRIVEKIEHWRERHPLSVVLLCGMLLISLALPLRHMVASSPTMTILPRESNARIVYDTVAGNFPNATLSPISIIVEPHAGNMMNASNLDALRTLSRDLGLVDGVIAVDSVWGYIPIGITSEAFATSLLLEPELVKATSPFLTRDAALISLTADAGLDAEGRRELVTKLREAMPGFTGGGLTIRMGGDAGLDLDLMQHVEERAPLVIGFVIGLTWLALFVQFRSVFLPIKAILLNLMSLGASFGALVWIFQDGHLANVLRFEPTGYTVVLIPILMFCFLFGLSMDFEVIMLSRIREAWEETGDNARAIDLGLHRSAGIVTASAAVMLVVFAAFGASELQVIKSLGVGLGIAVFIDATIIRMLLLPATMQLMGRWNWWTPVWRARPRETPSSTPLFRNDVPGEDGHIDLRNDPLSGKILHD